MNVKNLVLGVGIFVVFMLMLHFGIEAFYPSPKYNDFCNSNQFGPYPTKYDYANPGVNCTFSQTLQVQSDACYNIGGQPVYSYDANSCTNGIKECNMCNKEFSDSQNSHDKVVFVVALIVGLIALFVGFGILSVEPVGSSLMASGVGAIFYGSARNWINLTNVWRFLLLLLALILLIWIAMKLNKDKTKKK